MAEETEEERKERKPVGAGEGAVKKKQRKLKKQGSD